MPNLVLFTVEDLRNWLLRSRIAAGLSERIIAPVRALAIINNPYVQDSDPVVAALFVDGEVAAYTAAFPEMIDGQRKWWFSSLWCAPEHRGQGYGIVVIGSLVEVYGSEHCLDRWGASDTVGIFTYLGMKTIYSPRYILGSKISRSTTKGKILSLVRTTQKKLCGFLKGAGSKEDYRLCYLPQIDADSYAFIQEQRKKDFFLHSQEMLNWELRYSFTISAPLVERTTTCSSYFQAEICDTQMYAVQVRDNEGIIGFYMMKRNDDCLHMLYLYYTDRARNKVFASIRDHLKKMHIAQFDTDNGELADYIRREVYFPKYRTLDISFSFPESFPGPSDQTLQYGDGDNFAIVS